MRTVRLGDILNVQNGFAFDSDLFSENEGLPLIRIRDLKEGTTTTTRYKGKYDESFVVRKGDYLIGMDGEFRCHKWKGEEALLNQRVCRLIDFNSSVHPEFIFYGINLHLARIERNTAFVTVKHISSKQIKEIKFSLPPIDEQIRIANILSKAEALINQRKESLRLLDEFLNSTFLDMFQGEYKANKKEYLINDLKIGGSESFSNGPFGSDLLTTELQKEGIPVIYIRDIRNGIFSWKSAVYVTHDKAQSLPNCHVHGGDILIAKVGDPPGISAVYPHDLGLSIITQDVIRIRVKNEIISPHYLSYYLNSPKGKQLIKKISVAGTRNRFSLGDFKKIKIEVPDLESQKKFVELVVRIDALKQKYGGSLRNMSQLFESLSHHSFRNNA